MSRKNILHYAGFTPVRSPVMLNIYHFSKAQLNVFYFIEFDFLYFFLIQRNFVNIFSLSTLFTDMETMIGNTDWYISGSVIDSTLENNYNIEKGTIEFKSFKYRFILFPCSHLIGVRFKLVWCIRPLNLFKTRDGERKKFNLVKFKTQSGSSFWLKWKLLKQKQFCFLCMSCCWR